MPDALDELLDFLADKRAGMRARAAGVIQGLTGSNDGISALIERKSRLIPALLHLLGGTELEATPAVTALVNLTGFSEVATLAVHNGVVERAMGCLREGCQIELHLMLLVNITNTEGGLSIFCQEGKHLEGFYITRIAQMMLKEISSCNADHCARILTNVTRHPIGRRVFLDHSLGLLRAVLPTISSSSSARRLAFFSALRNCCVDELSCHALLTNPDLCETSTCMMPMDEYSHSKLQGCDLSNVTTAAKDIVCALLRPISGSKLHVECCDTVRQACAEAVANLARSESGRAALVACEAPKVIKSGYDVEEHRETQEALELAAAQFLTHGVVPLSMQPSGGLHRAEILS